MKSAVTLYILDKRADCTLKCTLWGYKGRMTENWSRKGTYLTIYRKCMSSSWGNYIEVSNSSKLYVKQFKLFPCGTLVHFIVGCINVLPEEEKRRERDRDRGRERCYCVLSISFISILQNDYTYSSKLSVVGSSTNCVSVLLIMMSFGLI